MQNNSLENFIKGFLTEYRGWDPQKELGGGPGGPVRFSPRVSMTRPSVSPRFHAPTPRTITIPPSQQIGPVTPQVYVSPTPSIPVPQPLLIPQPGIPSPKVEVMPASAERVKGPKAGYVEPMTGFEDWGSPMPALKVEPKTSVDTGLSTRTSTGTQTKTSVDTGTQTRTSTKTGTETSVQPSFSPDFYAPGSDPKLQLKTTVAQPKPQLEPKPEPQPEVEVKTEPKVNPKYKELEDKQFETMRRIIKGEPLFPQTPSSASGLQSVSSGDYGAILPVAGMFASTSTTTKKQRSLTKGKSPAFIAAKEVVENYITEQQRQDRIDSVLTGMIMEGQGQLSRLNKIIAVLKEKKRQGEATQNDLKKLKNLTRSD